MNNTSDKTFSQLLMLFVSVVIAGFLYHHSVTTDLNNQLERVNAEYAAYRDAVKDSRR